MSISLPFNSNRYSTYFEDYWPGDGGLSAVNAIGTQLRDPMNLGLTRWRMTVSRNKWTSPRKSKGIPRVNARRRLKVMGQNNNCIDSVIYFCIVKNQGCGKPLKLHSQISSPIYTIAFCIDAPHTALLASRDTATTARYSYGIYEEHEPTSECGPREEKGGGEGKGEIS